MKRICVYCGSNPGSRPGYVRAGRALGHELARRDVGLVYGGASVGVMGAVADGVLDHGGSAIGVLPHFFATKEVAHSGLDELLIVNSMHQRKARMAELSDGFIALPGGWGTIEEIFEMLTWAQLGHHEKPCGLLNIKSYYDDLFSFLEKAMEEQFVREEYRPMMMMDTSPAGLLDRFGSYRAPRVKKWIGPEET
ncbi:MAG: TIGR00730 family Rossman fold protein [Xanthomonadales bacterium]|nr:TIGR00730 family Rossman fold protein [Gammaproteobacteria bacterium]MBT8051326.1 TIGR00730 family Rossman fold protein [Gammaproteobacteria bacterium]MBT8057341.1 TIGR00730 family Rossman fold protein [Gammaproteobacteria bacterium]NNJ77772.1 TIGR00730 family Rossman fold protein [Xanthomonadales bacterium]NNL04689.1 TIGR00730 family Rossman fold protein [Xanthomonadales bacterium]